MYKNIKFLIKKYEGVLNLCNLAGVKLPLTELKLDTLYYMVGWKGKANGRS